MPGFQSLPHAKISLVNSSEITHSYCTLIMCPPGKYLFKNKRAAKNILFKTTTVIEIGIVWS